MNIDSKNITIGVVINTSWNVFNFRLGLLKSFFDKGCRIVVITPEDEYTPLIKSFGYEHYHVHINNKGTNPLQDIKLTMDFYQLFKKVKPDLLLHYTIKPNIYGNIAAYFAGIPVVSNISGLGTVFLNNSFSSRIARGLYKVSLKIPKKILYQNQHDRELFISSKLVAENKTGLVPGSGIDTEKYLPVFYNADPNNIRFLFIARLVKDKGLIEYVNAARIIKLHYPFAEFSVLGAYYPGNPTAITEEEMNEWLEEGVVTYLGTSNNVEKVISDTDCVVLPSYREGLSRVLLEAASMAKPIITTNTPGCRDVVDEGVNGFLCEPRDVTTLVAAIRKMIHLDINKRLEMGSKGREKVLQRFDESIVINKYTEVVEEIFS